MSFLISIGILLFTQSSFALPPDQKITVRRDASVLDTHLPKPDQKILEPSPVPEGFKIMVPEWADSDAVMLSWAEKNFVSAFTANTKVISFADSDADVRWWKRWLSEKNIPNPRNFDILKIKTDSIFTRDYGAEFIYRNRNLEMVDFAYYSTRPDDDKAPFALAKILNIPIHSIGLYSEGGNILGDGFLRGYATTWLKNSNKKLTIETLTGRLLDFLGWRAITIHPFVNLEDFWAHIDTLAKQVSHDTWLVAQFPEGSKYYAGLESFVEMLLKARATHGGKFKVFRLPMVKKMNDQGEESFRGYLNSLIHNDSVFVPSYGDEQDKTYYEIYKAAMPGYKVVPVYAPTTFWGDAVHCRARNLPKVQSLYLAPIASVQKNQTIAVYANGYWPESAEIVSYTTIHWRINDGAWQTKEMERMGEAMYAELPPQPEGTKLSYFIEGGLVGQKKVRFPRFAPLKTYDYLVE